MSNIEQYFTEKEWSCITMAPLYSGLAIMFSDINWTNLVGSLKKEGNVLFSSIEKYKNEYPNNTLIQETLGTFKDVNSLLVHMDRLEKLSKELKDDNLNKELQELLNGDEKLEKSIAKSNWVGMIEEIMKNGCIIMVYYTKSFLDKKKLVVTEQREFKEVLYKITVDVANAASEGFFGFGKKISKKEEAVLVILKKILE